MANQDTMSLHYLFRTKVGQTSKVLETFEVSLGLILIP
jgi:hypothetical protein